MTQYIAPKYIRITLCLIISWLGIGGICGQSKIQLKNYVDSLQNQLEKVDENEQIRIYLELLEPENKVAAQHEKITDNALAFAEKTGSELLKARAALQSSLDLINSGQHALATRRLEMAYNYYSQQPVDKLLVTTMILEGYNFHRQNYVTEALKVYLRALPLAKEIKDLKRTNNLYNRIVNIYTAQGDYRKALYYADLIGQSCGEKLDNSCPFYLVVQHTVGDVYLDMNKVDSARLVITDYFSKMDNQTSPISRANNYMGMGRLKKHEGKWAAAITFTDSARVIALQTNRTKATTSAYQQLAGIYQETKQTELEIESLLQQKKLAEQHGFPTLKMAALDRLQAIYKNKNDFATAYQYATEWRAVKDSFELIERANLVKRHDELVAQYEGEEQMQLLENEQIKQRDYNNRLLFLLLFALLFLGLAAYFLYSRRRLNTSLQEKNNLLNQALEDREILIKEVHHRVKNNLQIITSLLNLQMRHVQHPEAKIALEDGRNRIRSIALIHQDLYREMKLTGIQSQKYIENLLRNLQLTFRAKQGQLKTDVNNVIVNEEVMVLIGLVINEAITNAYKHAFLNGDNGTIDLKFKQLEKHYQLEISDNGVGFDFVKKRHSDSTFGLQLIEDMTTKLKANLEVQSNSNGTKLSLLIPIAKAIQGSDTFKVSDPSNPTKSVKK